mmetsp:Transcript_45854/g.71847  ORF Transcript_45854/g.71847 Transcript_45854/m.71847 type:complete len:97 (+) Transcript_45854:1293-1583(+)
MPEPGNPYQGTRRVAYIPDTPEGQQVKELLKVAFQRGLIFVVGQSVTTGVKNTTIWNGIHHKTSPDGGAARHGFPDEGYISRVSEELASKGVVAEP